MFGFEYESDEEAVQIGNSSSTSTPVNYRFIIGENGEGIYRRTEPDKCEYRDTSNPSTNTSPLNTSIDTIDTPPHGSANKNSKNNTVFMGKAAPPAMQKRNIPVPKIAKQNDIGVYQPTTLKQHGQHDKKETILWDYSKTGAKNGYQEGAMMFSKEKHDDFISKDRSKIEQLRPPYPSSSLNNDVEEQALEYAVAKAKALEELQQEPVYRFASLVCGKIGRTDVQFLIDTSSYKSMKLPAPRSANIRVVKEYRKRNLDSISNSGGSNAKHTHPPAWAADTSGRQYNGDDNYDDNDKKGLGTSHQTTSVHYNFKEEEAADGLLMLQKYDELDRNLQWMSHYTVTGTITMKPIFLAALGNTIAFLRKCPRLCGVTQKDVIQCKDEIAFSYLADLTGLYILKNINSSGSRWTEKHVSISVLYEIAKTELQIKTNIILEHGRGIVFIHESNYGGLFGGYIQTPQVEFEGVYNKAIFG